MVRHGRIILLTFLLAVCLVIPAAAVNLTFSNGTGVTLIPTTVGQYYTSINSSNLSWVVIGAIVPQPLVDIFGGGEFGWRVVWFSVFGVMFIVMFGRQKNILIPMLVGWLTAFFIIERIPLEEQWMFTAFLYAAAIGVIMYWVISKR